MTPTTFTTILRTVPEKERGYGRCYSCGFLSRHKFWDPESNGHICSGCLTSYIAAERALLLTPGICRPAPNHGAKDG